GPGRRIAQDPGHSDPSTGIQGIAAYFRVELGAGGATSNDDRSALSNINGIFSFRGSVQVTLNTTLQDQDFQIPQEFLSVLPAGFQTHILIGASAPNIDGSASSTNGAGFYLQAIVTGEITLGGILTMS